MNSKMLATIVIDADVFMHSENPTVPLRADCKQLLTRLLAGTTKLCVDEGFDLDESKNRSHIGHEYLTRVRQVSPAFAVIVLMGTRGRIIKIERHIEYSVSRIVCRNVADKSDRVYVRVAYKSASKTLVSHDSAAYPQKTKQILRTALNVRVLDAPAAKTEV